MAELKRMMELKQMMLVHTEPYPSVKIYEVRSALGMYLSLEQCLDHRANCRQVLNLSTEGLENLRLAIEDLQRIYPPHRVTQAHSVWMNRDLDASIGR